MQSRIAPSLGDGFAGTPNEVWGTTEYLNDTDPTVFFGLYGLPDFYALWRHKGMKFILWAGSDITHFKKGYWLDTEGLIRLNPEPLAKWIAENCTSYVENELEQHELRLCGIPSLVVPSFLGNVKDYPERYKPGKLRFYTSVSGNDFELYGWDQIEDLSDDYPEAEFHLYGNTEPWYTDKPNIFVHGRVPQAEMNEQIQNMTGALRLTKHDGFSEILAKSILWGQWPVSPHIKYPHISTSIDEVKNEPNTDGRNYYLKHLNNYPFNVTKH
jgi:hypothetical protein